MHAAQPKVDSVKLNKISFAVEHRLAWFSYLKLSLANNIRCQRMSTILSVLHAEQGLSAIPILCNASQN